MRMPPASRRCIRRRRDIAGRAAFAAAYPLHTPVAAAHSASGRGALSARRASIESLTSSTLGGKSSSNGRSHSTSAGCCCCADRLLLWRTPQCSMPSLVHGGATLILIGRRGGHPFVTTVCMSSNARFDRCDARVALSSPSQRNEIARTSDDGRAQRPFAPDREGI